MSTRGKTLSKRTLLANPAYVGQRFGARVVLAIEGAVKGYQMWSVRCDCGDVRTVSAIGLVKGRYYGCRDCQRRDQISHRSRCWRGGCHIPMTEFNRWRRSAVKRDLEWAVSVSYLDTLIETQNWTCSLTGEKLSFNHGYNNSLGGNASLDRIDSGRGYLPGNVRFVTKAVNFAKQALTDADFVELCDRVVNHARSKLRQEAA